MSSQNRMSLYMPTELTEYVKKLVERRSQRAGGIKVSRNEVMAQLFERLVRLEEIHETDVIDWLGELIDSEDSEEDPLQFAAA